jgi:glutamate/tyrosine decarboxylase-like PLP-dependent enzyme
VIPALERDLLELNTILERAKEAALEGLQSLETRHVNPSQLERPAEGLPNEGDGTLGTLEHFLERYASGLSASAGARYLGFVTGGATPAALVGDWLCSAFDQNAADNGAVATHLEHETLGMLRDLLGLPDGFTGSFVSGATMANFVGLAQARQWIGERHGFDIASDGLHGVPRFPILAATAHSSSFKALSMLGMGRANLETVPTLAHREAMDVDALRDRLEASNQPSIVIASSGTVNTTDFDDLRRILELRTRFQFWLHVDAAFGGFAATSPSLAHLVAGLEGADSVTVDAHKWLNVPYDSAMQFTRHRDVQLRVFQNSGAAYLGAVSPAFVHLTPENSRRWRALSAWFTLRAYGRDGYREIVERDCALARELGRNIQHSSEFELLAEVRLNVVCFRARHADTTAFLERLRASGEAFMTPTTFLGRTAARAAFSNWRTTPQDLERIWTAMLEAVRA